MPTRGCQRQVGDHGFTVAEKDGVLRSPPLPGGPLAMDVHGMGIMVLLRMTIRRR